MHKVVLLDLPKINTVFKFKLKGFLIIIFFFFNHFAPSKAVKPLRCNGLLSVREYEKNILLRREDNKNKN